MSLSICESLRPWNLLTGVMNTDECDCSCLLDEHSKDMFLSLIFVVIHVESFAFTLDTSERRKPTLGGIRSRKVSSFLMLGRLVVDAEVYD